MEKLTFWDEGGKVETIGSMDEIEGMMDTETAYRVLLGSCYSGVKYKELSKTIAELKDEKHHEIKCSPVEAAMKMDGADQNLPVPEDIFCFMEKAYMDGIDVIGDRRCFFLLGRLYSSERYGHIDYPKAAKWFAAGAQAGDGKSEAMLGKCHLLGWGVPKNYELAFQHLAKWALISGENTEAMYLLGDMFYEGLYVQQDLVQAYELYQKAWKADKAGYCIAGVQTLLRLADYELDSIGEKEACHYALACYQRAESDSYDYMLSHPKEATECILRAKEGQKAARRKLKKLISKLV